MKLRLLLISFLFFSLGDNSLASPLSHISFFSKENFSSLQIKEQITVANLRAVLVICNTNKKIFAEKHWMNRCFQSLGICNGMAVKKILISASLHQLTKSPGLNTKCNKN